MNTTRSLRRATALGAPAFFTLLTTLVCAPIRTANAAPPIDEEGFPLPPEAYVVGSLKVAAQPLVGSSVEINAESVKIQTHGAVLALPSYTWTLVAKPTGSSAALGGSALRRTLLLDRAGTYRVRLVACPSTCSVSGITVEGRTLETVIEAKSEIQTPPGLAPVVPPFGARATVPASYPGADGKCGGGPINGAAWTRPQWVTTATFSGPSDYKLLEGTVHEVNVAGTDNPLNHDSQDWNLHVVPDAPYQYLMNKEMVDSAGDTMEIEWQRNHFPEPFRAARGDRVSVFGYHIFDCGHPSAIVIDRNYPTEIHPPVLAATHRPRVFQLPSEALLDLDRDGVANEKVGGNVWVSGIVTDVWADAHSGEVTSNCSATGLHQPGGYVLPGPCIEGPANIKRSYTFNVYLPKSPQQIAKAMGKADAKPTPLYYGVHAHPNGSAYGAATGPMPTIVVVREGEVTYLRVTIDLTGYAGQKIAQQIHAGWVYPKTDNWGLEHWRLNVPKIRVHSDGDSSIWEPWNDGDWRLWVGTNNTTNEWTNIFDCNGCIKSSTNYTPSSGAWRSGSTGPDGRIFGDLALLPSQQPLLYSTAYEDDPIDDNGLGTLQGKTLTKADGASGLAKAGFYTMYWNMKRIGASTASLSTASQNLFNDYKITAPSTNVPPLEMFAVAEFAPPYAKKVRVNVVPILGNVSAPLIEEGISKATATEQAAALTTLRAKVDANIAASPKAKPRLLKALEPLRNMVPKAAWNARFGDLLPKP